MTISTDASLLGWGATWPGTTIDGRWLPAEANSHINLLELKAALLALQAFFRTYTPTLRHILLQMDNSTAVAYVNKRGGTRSYGLSTKALKLWALLLHAGCWITAKHIPGTSNTIADLASRQFTSYSKWTPPSGCVSSDSTTNLPTRCGSLCHSSQPSPPSVCIQIPGSRSDGNGCIPLRLESVEDLRTTCPSTEDYPEDQAG